MVLPTGYDPVSYHYQWYALPIELQKHDNYLLIFNTTKKNQIIPTTRTIAKGIHRGERTHHHDQVIKFVNFRAINKIARAGKNPIAGVPEVVFEVLLIIYSPSYKWRT